MHCRELFDIGLIGIHRIQTAAIGDVGKINNAVHFKKQQPQDRTAMKAIRTSLLASLAAALFSVTPASASNFLDGAVSNDIRYNPNGSVYAVEGITSPDGRVFGKMGHSERKGEGLYKNVPGEYDIRMFESAVKYFR